MYSETVAFLFLLFLDSYCICKLFHSGNTICFHLWLTLGVIHQPLLVNTFGFEIAQQHVYVSRTLSSPLLHFLKRAGTCVHVSACFLASGLTNRSYQPNVSHQAPLQCTTCRFGKHSLCREVSAKTMRLMWNTTYFITFSFFHFFVAFKRMSFQTSWSCVKQMCLHSTCCLRT